MTWLNKPHECDIPTEVYNVPKLTDIWECEHCRQNWRVKTISNGKAGTYGQYILTFVAIPWPSYKGEY